MNSKEARTFAVTVAMESVDEVAPHARVARHASHSEVNSPRFSPYPSIRSTSASVNRTGLSNAQHGNESAERNRQISVISNTGIVNQQHLNGYDEQVNSLSGDYQQICSDNAQDGDGPPLQGSSPSLTSVERPTQLEPISVADPVVTDLLPVNNVNSALEGDQVRPPTSDSHTGGARLLPDIIIRNTNQTEEDDELEALADALFQGEAHSLDNLGLSEEDRQVLMEMTRDDDDASQGGNAAEDETAQQRGLAPDDHAIHPHHRSAFHPVPQQNQPAAEPITSPILVQPPGTTPRLNRPAIRSARRLGRSSRPMFVPEFIIHVGNHPNGGRRTMVTDILDEEFIREFLDNDDDNRDRGLSREQIAKIKSYRMTKKKLTPNAACSICLEDFKIGKFINILPCSHEFHVVCLRSWLKKNSTCPNCRQNAI